MPKNFIETTLVSSRLPPQHPVVRGVMEARRLLGGSFPNHVLRIDIVPEIKKRQDGARVKGTCDGSNPLGSKITIYAGSICERTSDPDNISFKAARTTIHEVGHAQVVLEIHVGINNIPANDLIYHEARAEKFTADILDRRHPQHPKDLSWDDIEF